MPLDCLTLLVPELLWPEPEDHEALDFECPGLSGLLARARFSRAERQSVEAVLMGLFGYAANTACGAFRLRGESEVPADAATARWIIADPVHLRFDRERLILAGSSALAISPEEAASLVDGLNHYFTDLGVFHALCAERWYLRLADGTGEHALERLDAPPLSAVAGRSVERLLEEIIEEREIRKLLNEIQIFLHAHPVNRRREENNRATINSLWLCGGGSPPPTSPSPVTTDFDSAWGKDPLARGLALAAGLPARALPESVDALLTEALPSTRPLVVLDDLAEPICYQNCADYRQSLAALEMRWFAPVWRALATGVIGTLRLVAPTAYGTLTWEAGRLAPWLFWCRPQTLAETVAALIRHQPQFKHQKGLAA